MPPQHTALNRVPLKRHARLCTGNANPAGTQFQHPDTTPAKPGMVPLGQKADRNSHPVPLYVVTAEACSCHRFNGICQNSSGWSRWYYSNGIPCSLRDSWRAEFSFMTRRKDSAHRSARSRRLPHFHPARTVLHSVHGPLSTTPLCGLSLYHPRG